MSDPARRDRCDKFGAIRLVYLVPVCTSVREATVGRAGRRRPIERGAMETMSSQVPALVVGLLKAVPLGLQSYETRGRRSRRSGERFALSRIGRRPRKSPWNAVL